MSKVTKKELQLLLDLYTDKILRIVEENVEDKEKSTKIQNQIKKILEPYELKK